MGAGAADRPHGRKVFARLTPKGYRVRMMEPGEAPALRHMAATGKEPAAPAGSVRPGLAGPSQDEFVRWLLRHEIFVAETKTGVPVGFAAARDLVDLYWVAALVLSAEQDGSGIDKALLKAVVARAGWFFHRAVAVATSPEAATEDFYRSRGFMTVPRKDVPSILRDPLGAGRAPDRAPDPGTIMIKWL